MDTTSMRITSVGRDWDAVRLPRYLGLLAVGRLGDAVGSVVVDPGARRLYVLVPVGAAARWALPGTRALGQGSFLALPGQGRTAPPGPYWLTCCPSGRDLVDPQVLLSVLSDVPRNASCP